MTLATSAGRSATPSSPPGGPAPALNALAEASRPGTRTGYGFAYLDEATKREVRRALVKAVCIPGHQVPFASREMPVARGWGSGGLQITLSIVEPEDRVKVIDQGDDHSMNAAALRDLVVATTGAEAVTDARQANVIQTRHRIPEDGLEAGQILVFQVPIADPLRGVDPRPSVTRRLHAEADYSGAWLRLYEDHAHLGRSSFAHSYPVEVAGPPAPAGSRGPAHPGYLMSPSPIPRWDVGRLDRAPFLSLFGAGREATVYAVPPHTAVTPLAFDDRPFEAEVFEQPCWRCGSRESFLTEEHAEDGVRLACSDTDWCRRRQEAALT